MEHIIHYYVAIAASLTDNLGAECSLFKCIQFIYKTQNFK